MIRLLLPVIFPSWRFFSSIGPAPRIDYGFLRTGEDAPSQWQEFRPRPHELTLLQGLARLFWNPQWNEFLYMNSCAERLFDAPNDMREKEIMRRLQAALAAGEITAPADARQLVYRIRAVIREGAEVSEPVLFTARPASIESAA